MHYRWLTAASAGLALGGALIMQLAGPGAAASAAPARAPPRHAEITGPARGPGPAGRPGAAGVPAAFRDVRIGQ
jgi:hypothetical protein